MKAMIALLFAVSLAPAAAHAQIPRAESSPADIVILEKNWRQDVRNPALDEDPFDANAEFTDAQRAQKMQELQNAIRGRSAESREPPPPRPQKPDDRPAKSQVVYLYRARIRNAGEKTIRAVDWEYLFVDPNTQKEAGRHRYSSKLKVRPGRSGELLGRSNAPRTSTVDVRSSGKELTEQIIIYRVEYEDGSVWENPAR
jgi:hypothetical protein